MRGDLDVPGYAYAVQWGDAEQQVRGERRDG
jgi:hypothetical protein